MRFVFFIALLAASPSSVSGCTGRTRAPEPQDVVALELHSWSAGRNGPQYYVTQIEPSTGCVSSETVTDGIVNIVRDCSLPQLIRPRVAELLALFELDEAPRAAAERIDEGSEGHGAVFERSDGSRWTSSSKLLRAGAELLDRDAAEWLIMGPPPSELPATPEGWTQLILKDEKGVVERVLTSDGRWSCESWRVSDQSLEHKILIHRGRVTPELAAELLDGFADGFVEAVPNSSPWTAALERVEPSATIELHGDALVEHWNAFADEFGDACMIESP